jgi:NAD(P)-dependent dehydrogenase (short-subunit alcohol dehydrogenase family)
MNVSGKVVVVTGAGSGMGRELALELARRGATIAAVDFRADTLAETASLVKQTGGTISTHTLDVSDLSKVAALPAAVAKAHGHVDAIINNAGIIQPFVPISNLPWKDVEHVMAVNFFGPVALVQAFLPLLSKRPEAHILNVSSMGAYAPVPGQTVYGASKAADQAVYRGSAVRAHGYEDRRHYRVPRRDRNEYCGELGNDGHGCRFGRSVEVSHDPSPRRGEGDGRCDRSQQASNHHRLRRDVHGSPLTA